MNSEDPVVGAVRLLELAIAAKPDELVLHEQLEAALVAICRDQPAAFTSLLHLTNLQARADDLRGIVLGYTRAIKTAQLGGLWLDEASTPPSIRPLVVHAMHVAHNGRTDVFYEWMEPRLARYGKDELARVVKCLTMYLGLEPTLRADPRQQPTFLYFPGLPVAPVFPREALPFAEAFEAETAAITDELVRVRDGSGVQPFHYDVPEAQRDKLTTGGSWDAYFFYVDGERVDAHHEACPQVSSVLARLPLDHVRDHTSVRI